MRVPVSLLIFSALVAVAPAWGQSAASGPGRTRVTPTVPSAPSAAPAPRTDARAALTAVGEAWLAEDLSAIVKHFGSRRASVDLGSLGRSGEYGSAQVYFLFKRLFDRTETREVRLDKLRPAGDSPHATFDWQYVDERKGSSHRVRLFVSMRREAGAWVVDEIKVVPR